MNQIDSSDWKELLQLLNVNPWETLVFSFPKFKVRYSIEKDENDFQILCFEIEGKKHSSSYTGWKTYQFDSTQKDFQFCYFVSHPQAFQILETRKNFFRIRTEKNFSIYDMCYYLIRDNLF